MWMNTYTILYVAILHSRSTRIACCIQEYCTTHVHLFVQYLRDYAENYVVIC